MRIELQYVSEEYPMTIPSSCVRYDGTGAAYVYEVVEQQRNFGKEYVVWKTGITIEDQDEKKVVVSELSALFEVSEETIRRDLDKLDRDGLAIKSYGGAVLNENTGMDMPFNVRKKRNMKAKQEIASLVAGLVQEGEHIIVDPSTTAVAVVKALKSKKKLTVITSSIEDADLSFPT